MRRVYRYKSIIFVLVMLLALVPGFGVSCSTVPSRLNIFAAAGARPPLDEICDKFEAEHGTTVEINYGGGGEVLNQMVLSKSGDIYIAPEQSFMETAAVKQAIDTETVESIAYMVPVIAVPRGNPANIRALDDLARTGVRVAVTRPETTLLGKYAPEIFQKAGLGEEINKNIVTQAARPDSLLTMLVMKQVDAGIIWHFYGVQIPEDIEVIFLPPEQLTGIGEMQIAVSAYCRDEKLARRFIDYVVSENGQGIFKNHGYFISAGEVSRYWH
jgi:molybdate transport system substrate-binding protein